MSYIQKFKARALQNPEVKHEYEALAGQHQNIDALHSEQQQRRIEVYALLLEAIEHGGTTIGVIELAMKKTGLGEKGVRRKLAKMGYLRRCGRGFSVKQGFARM